MSYLSSLSMPTAGGSFSIVPGGGMALRPSYMMNVSPTPSEFGGSGAPFLGGAEYSNRLAWARRPETPDAAVLRNTYARSRREHETLMRAQAAQAADDNAFLDSATPSELSNLFGAPRTEREARLQSLIQSDVNAKQRGVALIPTYLDKLKYGQLEANLAKTRIDNYLDPMRFDVQKRNADSEIAHRSQDEKFTSQRLADEYLANKDRVDFENRKLAQDASQFDARLQNSNSQQDRADARLANSNFRELQRAVRAGEIAADDVIGQIPTLTAGQQAILRGHEAFALQDANDAAALAKNYNNRLAEPIPGLPGAKAGFLGHLFGAQDAPDSPPTDMQIRTHQEGVMRDFQRDPRARNRVMLDPETGRFVPLIRPPARASLPPPAVGNPVYDAFGGGDMGSGGAGPYGMSDTPSYNPNGRVSDYMDGPSAPGSYLNSLAPQSGTYDGFMPQGSNGQQTQGVPSNLPDGQYRARDGTQYIVIGGVRYRM